MGPHTQAGNNSGRTGRTPHVYGGLSALPQWRQVVLKFHFPILFVTCYKPPPEGKEVSDSSLLPPPQSEHMHAQLSQECMCMWKGLVGTDLTYTHKPTQPLSSIGRSEAHRGVWQPLTPLSPFRTHAHLAELSVHVYAGKGVRREGCWLNKCLV